MKKAIVTGANGFIGRSLLKRLIESGVCVLAVDLCFADSSIFNNEQVRKVETDLSNMEALEAAIPEDDYDAFYHLAWQGVNGAGKADPDIQLKNIKMAVNCAETAKRKGCKKVLYAGTVAERAVESLPALGQTSGGMMYGVAKHCARLMVEAYCKHIGMDFVWMQFSNIYGPKNQTGNLISYTVSELKAGREALFGPASQPYDFIEVDDLIEAVYRLGETKTLRSFYFIGSGQPRILKEYLYEIGELYGRRDLIKIGAREDDGIVYAMDMFDTGMLVSEIGSYVTKTFTEGIRDVLNYE